MAHDDEDPYGGDWGEIGGWPEPEVPPDEEEATAWPPPDEPPQEPGPEPGRQPEEGSEG